MQHLNRNSQLKSYHKVVFDLTKKTLNHRYMIDFHYKMRFRTSKKENRHKTRKS